VSLRRDIAVTTADAAAYSLMVGFGETSFPAFALALGLGPVTAGMLATVPLLVAALVQLVTPAAVAWMNSNRRWVVICTTVQSLSFVPLIVWAVRGSASAWELLLAASVYWSAGMAGTPAWNSWLATIVPARVRTPVFAHRNRLGQFGTFLGFVIGGLLLRAAEQRALVLQAFAVIFVFAALCRPVSTALVASCREREPAAGREPAGAGRRPFLLGRLRHTVAGMTRRPSGRLVVFLCTFVFGAQVAAPYFIPYMLKDRGFSYLAFTIVVGASFLAKGLTLPSLGRLASRTGSVRLLWLSCFAIAPLALLWLPSADVPYLVGVQVLAGTCWAAYELAVALLFFDAVGDRERTGVVTVYNVGLALAMVAGATCGGLILRWFGESTTGYVAVFIVSTVVRLASLPLLRHVRKAEAV
jgi:MFS family permease